MLKRLLMELNSVQIGHVDQQIHEGSCSLGVRSWPMQRTITTKAVILYCTGLMETRSLTVVEVRYLRWMISDFKYKTYLKTVVQFMLKIAILPDVNKMYINDGWKILCTRQIPRKCEFLHRRWRDEKDPSTKRLAKVRLNEIGRFHEIGELYEIGRLQEKAKAHILVNQKYLDLSVTILELMVRKLMKYFEWSAKNSPQKCVSTK